ncbi:MAG TPA: phage minor head protein [Allosphingosinicella sp.]|nr:phage minor head protein [Allosphingosinicella sp.]
MAVDTAELIRIIERKRPRAIRSWRELGAEEYARAFTAAATAESDIVADLYEGLLGTMREGGGESDFADRMMPVLRDKGWLPQLDDKALGRRVRLIYDTNIRTSQAVGKWRAAQRTKQFLPYIRYSAVMDSRTRPAHAALHGIIRPVDDPFWAQAYPPCGFQCRCIASQLSRSQAARYGGVSDEAAATEALRQARDLSSGEGEFWAYNVGALAEKAAVAQVQRANDRRLAGSPLISGTSTQGATIWGTLFTNLIGPLLERLMTD